MGQSVQWRSNPHLVLRYDEVLLQSALELQPRYLVNFLLTLWYNSITPHLHRFKADQGFSVCVLTLSLCVCV